MVDLRTEKEQTLTLDPHNWQAEEFERPPTLSGALVIAGSEALTSIQETLQHLIPELSPNAPVYIFEEKEKDRERASREKILRELSLVKRDVLVRPVNDYQVSRARRPKKRARRQPINLLSKKPW